MYFVVKLSDLRPVTCDLWPATCDLWPATRDLRPATCDLRPATCDLRIRPAVFVLVAENATFPSSKIDKATIEEHFNRRKRQGKIILGSAFFDRNQLINEHNILLLTSYSSVDLHAFLRVRRENSLSDTFPQLPIQKMWC